MSSLISLLFAGGSAASTAIMAPISALCCCIQGISCVYSTANLFTCCFQGALGKKRGISPQGAKLFYIVLLGACFVLALIFRFHSENIHFGFWKGNCVESTSVYEYIFANVERGCKGPEAVFRISFALSLFFGIMTVLSFFSESLHRGFWAIKLLLVVGLLVGVVFLNEFNVQHYAWVARAGACIFLVLQILILIDFAYQWNEQWIQKSSEASDEDTQKNWIYGILGSAAGMYIAAFTGIVLMYLHYNCEIGIGFTTETLIFLIIMTAISVFRSHFIENEVEGSLLPTAVVCAYIVNLCWSALQSNPDASCKPASSQTTASIIVGSIWGIVTLLWSTYSVSNNAGHLIKGQGLEAPLTSNMSDENQSSAGPIVQRDIELGDGDSDSVDEEVLVINDRPWMFHLTMLTASMYMSMLLTDWGTVSEVISAAGETSMWVKIVAQWVTIVLFTWTLVAPAILVDRDF